MCPSHTSHAVIAGAAVGAGLLLNGIGFLTLFGVLRHVEKKEKAKLRQAQALAAASSTGSLAIEQKTVIIENRGPQGGTAGVAEVVTTGPAGTQVSTVPTTVGGAAIVSTTTAGIPGHQVTVEPGKTATIIAEHPVGKPEEVKVVSTTQH